MLFRSVLLLSTLFGCALPAVGQSNGPIYVSPANPRAGEKVSVSLRSGYPAETSFKWSLDDTEVSTKRSFTFTPTAETAGRKVILVEIQTPNGRFAEHRETVDFARGNPAPDRLKERGTDPAPPGGGEAADPPPPLTPANQNDKYGLLPAIREQIDQRKVREYDQRFSDTARELQKYYREYADNASLSDEDSTVDNMGMSTKTLVDSLELLEKNRNIILRSDGSLRDQAWTFIFEDLKVLRTNVGIAHPDDFKTIKGYKDFYRGVADALEAEAIAQDKFISDFKTYSQYMQTSGGAAAARRRKSCLDMILGL